MPAFIRPTWNARFSLVCTAIFVFVSLACPPSSSAEIPPSHDGFDVFSSVSVLSSSPSFAIDHESSASSASKSLRTIIAQLIPAVGRGRPQIRRRRQRNV